MRSVTVAKVRDMLKSGVARELRVDHGLSLQDVASDIGVHRNTLHHWEQGRCMPNAEHALAYGELLTALQEITRQ